MGKRKTIAQSSDEEDYNEQAYASGSESPGETDSDCTSERKESQDEESEEEAPIASKKSNPTKPTSVKKPRYGSSAEKQENSAGDVKVGVNESGEKYVDLGKKRRATVRQFKGATFLDIREFYGDDNDLKPGKKGISLNKEQWETLKKSSEVIDKFFAKVGK
ncbi:PC4-domain-containing protein [Cubamyces sp. BRFM 1775]|nr:PC4-domain-containing protein [Cubamyces sp. BRFM 1775]